MNKLLKQTYTRLRYSEWTDSKEDAQISTIGFLLKYDPKNCPSKQAENEINSLISEVNDISLTKIPRWKTMMTSTTNHHEGKIHQNLSYDITCRTSDRAELLKLLNETFKRKRFQNNPFFCPYSLRYKSPDTFNSFIDWHADYCSNLMTVAIENIPREHMKNGFDQELRKKHPEISVIYEHRNTDKNRTNNAHIPIGRWNIMVKRENFNKLAITLRDSLKSEYDEFVMKNNPVNTYGIRFCPEVTSKLKVQDVNSDDDSLTTRDSWITYFESCSISTFEMSQENRTHKNLEATEPTVFNIEIPNEDLRKSYAQTTRTADSPSELTTRTTGKDLEITSLKSMIMRLEEQMRINSQQMNELRADNQKLHTEVNHLKNNNLCPLQVVGQTIQYHPESPPRRNDQIEDNIATSLESRFGNRGAKRQCDKNTPEKLKRNNSSSNP